MGQLASTENSNESTKLNLKASHIALLFQERAAGLLSAGALSSIATKVNMNDIAHSDAVLTHTDLGALLNLAGPVEGLECQPAERNEGNSDDVSQQAGESSIEYLVDLLYRSFTILGRLPYLANGKNETEQLTIKKLLVALAVYLGQLSEIWPDSSYLKLIFISLALEPLQNSDHQLNKEGKYSRQTGSLSPERVSEEKKSIDASMSDKEKLQIAGKEMPVCVINAHQTDVDDNKINCRAIKWNLLECLVNYDSLDIASLTISAYDLTLLFTMLLIANLIPEQSHSKMQDEFIRLASCKWSEFVAASILLSRYFDLGINLDNYKLIRISFDTFENGVQNLMGLRFEESFQRLIKTSLLLSMVDSKTSSIDEIKGGGGIKSPRAFVPSRLVSEANISLLSIFTKQLDAGVEMKPQNMVELYNGARSGFSIRSLELKIFKWQAPTIFFVSGKRLRNKTISKSKRYQEFDIEYPRYFRSSENPRKDWQKDNDRITYAVFVKQPWRNSNKNNFGDEDTTIIAILPRLDYFKSKSGLYSAGKLIYFSNLGMGVGFGNDQPVNKTNVRKFSPGSVSLTIEANLEFAVFRHIVNEGAHTPNYFEKSNQESVCNQNYEDRFVITDLEVWGVGSTKELDEQRKLWEWEERQAQARQGVNLKNLGEERAFLEMVGLVGHQGSGGSV